MPDFLMMTCPTCGAKLKVTDQIHLLMCANCGNEYMVHRDAGAIYLGPIAQDVSKIRVGVDKTAAELAIERLTKEIAEMDKEIEEAKHRNYSVLVPPMQGEAGYILGIIALIFVLVIAAFASAIFSSWILLVFTVILLAALVWTFIAFAKAGSKRNLEVERVKKIQLDRLGDIRDAEIAALEKNRHIANS